MLVACVLALGAACGGQTDSAADSTASSAALAVTGTPSEGQWQDGDEQIAWSSKIERGVITEITEQVTFGTDGTAERVLRFTNTGVLSGYRETRTQTAQQTDRSPAPMTVQIDLAFEGDSVTSQHKTVDGVDTPIRPYEIDNVKRHARTIYEYLRAPAPAAAPATAPAAARD